MLFVLLMRIIFMVKIYTYYDLNMPLSLLARDVLLQYYIVNKLY